MGFDWIKSYKSIERDPRTLRLCAFMDWSVNEAIGFLHRFWWWASDVAPDGVVTNVCHPGVVGGAFGLGRAVGDKALEGLKSSKWLECHDDGNITIPDRDKIWGAQVSEKEATRERVRRHREKRTCNALHERYVTPVKRDVTRIDQIRSETTPPLPPEPGGQDVCASFGTSTTTATTPQEVLAMYQEECARVPKGFTLDANAEEGAANIASDINTSGGLRTLGMVRGAIRKAHADPEKRNYRLLGLSKCYWQYLPAAGSGDHVAEADKMVTVYMVCNTCGRNRPLKAKKSEIGNIPPEPCDFIVGAYNPLKKQMGEACTGTRHPKLHLG